MGIEISDPGVLQGDNAIGDRQLGERKIHIGNIIKVVPNNHAGRSEQLERQKAVPDDMFEAMIAVDEDHFKTLILPFHLFEATADHRYIRPIPDQISNLILGQIFAPLNGGPFRERNLVAGIDGDDLHVRKLVGQNPGGRAAMGADLKESSGVIAAGQLENDTKVDPGGHQPFQTGIKVLRVGLEEELVQRFIA